MSSSVLTPDVEELSERATFEGPPSRRIRPWQVFWAFFFLYAITCGGHYTSGDGFYKVQWARQILAGGPYWVDATTGMPPKYGIGQSLIALPALASAKLLGRIGLHAEAPFYTLIFVLNGAFLLYLVACYLKDRYDAKKVWLTVFLIGLATMWWPYTKLDYTEPLITTFFFLSFLLLRNRLEWLGFGVAGFLLLLRTDSVLLIVILLGWQQWKHRTVATIARAAAAIVPFVLIFVALNLRRFGSPLDSGYVGETFSTPLLVGLYGILLSAGKSVFLFSPPLVAGFLAWKKFRARFSDEAVVFLAVFASQLLLYARWWDWSGDDSWGVRFMLTGVVCMTLPCVEVANRKLLAGVLALGMLIQIPGILVSGLEYVVTVHSGTLQRRRLGMNGWNTIDLEDIRFNPRYSQITANYALAFERMGVRHARTDEAQQARTGTPITDALQEQASSFDFWWCRFLPSKQSATAP